MSQTQGFVSQFEDGTCLLKINHKLYETQAIFKTCYAFINHCYIYLDYDGASYIQVQIRRKDGNSFHQKFAEEFLNELINQKLRISINAETHQVRELLIAKALFNIDVQTTLPKEIETALLKKDDYHADDRGIGNLQGT